MKLEKEISDGLKHDLGMVVCDNPFCQERGNWTNCYLSEKYRDCGRYPVKLETISTRRSNEKKG